MRMTALALLVLCSSTAFAQEVITTQPVVASVRPHGDVMHVFTQTLDVDYDMQADSGDHAAQWLVIDKATHTVTSSTFLPWGSVTASRIAIDDLTGIVYVGINDTVWAYSPATQQRLPDPVFTGLCTALTYDAPTGTLIISQRPSFDGPGTVVLLNLVTSTQKSIEAGINPQQSLVYRSLGGTPTVVTLCDGAFGQKNGGLTFIGADGGTMFLPLGDTPNHMAIDTTNNLLYVVMNGDHAVKVINLASKEITATWTTGTSGYDGPREVAMDDKWLYVTTYSGTLLCMDRTTGTVAHTITLPAKADPIACVDGNVWVGLSYKTGTYEGTGNVLIYATGTLDVREPVRGVMSASNVLLLDQFTPGRSITVTALNGSAVQHVEYNADYRELRTSNLASGTYVATDGSNVLLFNVVR